jgi:hypothetical protein
MMPKKPVLIAIIAVVVLLVIGGGVWAWKATQKPVVVEEPKATKKRIVEPVNVIPVEQRPVVYISPQADGRNIDIVVSTVKKEAKTVEFELEYTTENLVQGGQGEFDLATLPAMKKWLMGSCSAGGACSYHTNVTGGDIKTRFVGAENYALKNPWRYFDNKKTKLDTFSSKDAKFTAKSAAFAKTTYAVVTNSPGYPEGLKGTPASEPYVLATAADMSPETEVSIRLAEDGEATIMAWDGKAWTALKSTTAAKVVTASGPAADLYIAVKN